LFPEETSMEITPAPRRRVRRIAVNLVSGLLMLMAAVILVPAALGLQRYAIAGGSMTGTYNLGSLVFEEAVPVEELRVGDVITYVPPAESGIDNLVTHRIVAIDGSTFRTQGDANPDVDPWTFDLTAATQARVVWHVPFLGFPFLALQERNLRMLLIGLPAAVIALFALGEFISGLRPSRSARVSSSVARTEPHKSGV
jgi:signal peptidase